MVNISSFKIFKNILTPNIKIKCQNKNSVELQRITGELVPKTETHEISEESFESITSKRPPVKYYDIFNDIEQFIRYATSFRKYTIISVNNNGKDLFNTMINEKFDTYYMDLNNIIEKDSTLSYLIQKYKSYNSGEKLWVFRGDFFVGSREDMLDIIEKHKNKIK
jgi:hypothetical protein